MAVGDIFVGSYGRIDRVLVAAKWMRDSVFQSADDPIMIQHPDWDNLKYRYFFDNFKDLNLLQSLALLQQVKIWIVNEQLDYYTRTKSK